MSLKVGVWSDVACPWCDPHRLLHLALEHGRQDDLKERLDHATFTEGSRPSDHSDLRALATQAGLPEAEVDAVLQALDKAWSERSPLPLLTTGGSAPSCEGDCGTGHRRSGLLQPQQRWSLLTDSSSSAPSRPRAC